MAIFDECIKRTNKNVHGYRARVMTLKLLTQGFIMTTNGMIRVDRHEKTCLWGFRPSKTVQPTKLGRGLKLRI